MSILPKLWNPLKTRDAKGRIIQDALGKIKSTILTKQALKQRKGGPKCFCVGVKGSTRFTGSAK